MKRIVLFAIAFGIGFAGWAQKKNVNTASSALTRDEFSKAKSAIDEAILDETTKSDPKTWFIRGEVYTKLQGVEAYKNSNPIVEAARSYLKAAELDPSYRKQEMDARLLTAAQVFFNTGVQAYQEKKYTEAYDAFNMPIIISKLGDGGRFASYKVFDTVVADAYLYRGYSSSNAENFEQALPDLLKAKDNPITQSPDVYLDLIGIYQRLNKADLEVKMIQEARSLYPDNSKIRVTELSYFQRSGNQDAFLKKLEEAVAKDPGNADFHFILANGYNDLAFPKDASGKELPKPANYSELIGKAEKEYQAAISLDKTNKADYSYNLGALYFNQASGVVTAMNALGTSAQDQKKYDALAAERDALFGKALPYLETVFTALDANVSKLSQEDKITYQSVIIALREIYAKQSRMDKVTEMKNKLDAFNAK